MNYIIIDKLMQHQKMTDDECFEFLDVVNVRFCPQSVRGFCPEVAGFNAGTYEVPAYVL